MQMKKVRLKLLSQIKKLSLKLLPNRRLRTHLRRETSKPPTKLRKKQRRPLMPLILMTVMMKLKRSS